VKALQGILIGGATIAAMAFTAPAFAQATAGQERPAAAPAGKAGDQTMSEGEVRKVDRQGKKITLKHGPLKNLDMPAMTMAFQVADPAMLGKVKVGDKVRFHAENPGGKLTVTDIQPAK